MKKSVFLLVVVLVLGFRAVVFGEVGNPILPYGNYSVEDVRKFALADGDNNEKFRVALIALVQKKLDEAGESLILTKEHVSWIFDQVTEQEVWLEARQFKNSRWLKGEIDFYVSESRYEGNAGIFIYGKCSFPLYKTSCGNLFDAPLNKIPITEAPKPRPAPEPEPYIPPKEPSVVKEKEITVKEKETVIIIQQQQPQVVQQMIPVSTTPMMQSYGGSNFGFRVRIFAGSNRVGYYPQQQCYPQQRPQHYGGGYQRSYGRTVSHGTMSGGRGGYTQNHGTMSGGRGTMSGGGSGGGRAY